MKRTATFAGLTVLIGFLWLGIAGARTIFPFDADWRFLKSDATNAETVQFNDSAWRRLDVPHD